MPWAIVAGAAISAASAYASRDKNKNVSSTNANEPWWGNEGYLRDGFAEAKKQYDDLPYYPDQTYAGPSQATLSGLKMEEDRARAGSALFSSAKDQNMKTINGDYLNPSTNPYLQGAIDVANQGTIRGFNNSVIPQLQSAFASSGRYGSGLQNAAQNNASITLGNQLGMNAQNISYGNYNDERSRQAQAVANAPAYAQADYADAAHLLDVGQQREAITQQGIDEAMNRYNAPRNNLQQYMSLIQGNYGGTSTSTERNPGYKTGTSALLGGGFAGAGLGASLLGSYGQYQQSQPQQMPVQNQQSVWT